MAALYDHQLAQAEYVIDKYFNDHIAPIVARETSFLREKQREEAVDVLKKTPVYAGEEGLGLAALVQNRLSGETWNSKKSEYLLGRIEKSMKGDQSIQADMGALICPIKGAFIQQLGKDGYGQLSAQVGGDLAAVYLKTRVKDLLMEEMAKEHVPKSSMEYIFVHGLNETLVGMFVKVRDSSTQSELDEKLQSMGMDLYHPSWFESAGKLAVSVGVDAVTTAGIGTARSAVLNRTTAGFAGKAVKAAGVDVGIRGLAFGFGKLTDGLTEELTSKDISELVYGSSTRLETARRQSKDLKVQTCYDISRLNGLLKKKLKVPSYRRPFNEATRNAVARTIMESTPSSSVLASKVKELSSLMKVSLKGVSAPTWMKEQSREECMKNSSFFLANALELSDSGAKVLKIKGKNWTVDQLVRRSWEYACAANEKEKEALLVQEQQGRQKQESFRQDEVKAKEPRPDRSSSERESEGSGTRRLSSEKKSLSETSLESWKNLLSDNGFDGIGHLGKNLGYTLAILPELLLGLFTGKVKGLDISGNLLPLAAIFAGFFIKKNPLLKMFMIGLGGTCLLNKVIHNNATTPHVAAPHYSPVPDEPLSPRLSSPAVNGRMLVMFVDGEPWRMRLREETAVAYAQGAVPLNALCNAALREYENYSDQLSHNYELNVRAEDSERVSRALK